MTVPTPQELDAAVRLAIQEEFLLGRRPTVASIASTLGRDASDVEAAFDRLAAGRALVLAQGTRDIRMAAPFAGVQTDFRVRCGDRSYYANCIWDALGIPAMLAAAGRPSDANIETRCDDCASPLWIDVTAGRVRAVPPDVVAHFAVPAAQWWADIVFT
jgi:hypothetical protein